MSTPFFFPLYAAASKGWLASLKQQRREARRGDTNGGGFAHSGAELEDGAEASQEYKVAANNSRSAHPPDPSQSTPDGASTTSEKSTVNRLGARASKIASSSSAIVQGGNGNVENTSVARVGNNTTASAAASSTSKQQVPGSASLVRKQHVDVPLSWTAGSPEYNQDVSLNWPAGSPRCANQDRASQYSQPQPAQQPAHHPVRAQQRGQHQQQTALIAALAAAQRQQQQQQQQPLTASKAIAATISISSRKPAAQVQNAATSSNSSSSSSGIHDYARGTSAVSHGKRQSNRVIPDSGGESELRFTQQTGRADTDRDASSSKSQPRDNKRKKERDLGGELHTGNVLSGKRTRGAPTKLSEN